MRKSKTCNKQHEKNKIFEKIYNAYKCLCKIKITPKKFDFNFFRCFIAFTLISVVLNCKWHFDYFLLFFLIFTLIFFITLSSQMLFIKEMESIRSLSVGEEIFQKPNYWYNKFIDNPFNFLFPISFVFVFGIGGLILYNNVTVNVTLIMVMIYFSIVVFLSMRCYLIYVYIFIYIRIICKSDCKFTEAVCLENNILPDDFAWFKKLSNLSTKIIAAFFTVAFLYILGFASFCFLPDFGVEIGSTIFYILWGLIFFFIIIIFTLLAVVERFYLRKISTKIKTNFIECLMKLPPIVEKTPLNELYLFSRNNYIFNILSYKPKSNITYIHNGYILFMWTLNFSATIVTLLQFTRELSA